MSKDITEKTLTRANMKIDDTVDKYITETKEVDAWNKIVDVIHSIDSMKQVDAARNMIRNYVKMYGKDNNHGMLELELKMKSRSLRR